MKDATNVANQGTTDTDVPVQTSFRLPPALYQKFKTTLDEQNRKMSSVILELVEEWVDPSAAPRRAHYVRQYLSSLPVAAAIKDPFGRVLFGNGEFLSLVGRQDEGIVGKAAKDYVKDTESAEIITRLDDAVRREKLPILCIEHMPFEGKLRHRMAIRFPIAPHGEIELTGVLGFDLEQFQNLTWSLRPEAKGTRIEKFETNASTRPECPLHCLKDFLHALPAIATVKNVQGRLLCVNGEYTKTLGKHRSEVEGRLSTEIWGRPFADLIVAHDLLVRETRQTFAIVEHLPTLAGVQDRLNFRFPIFDSNGQLEMTGTLGFDYELMRRGVELLKRSAPKACGYLFLPIEERDSLKLVCSA